MKSKRTVGGPKTGETRLPAVASENKPNLSEMGRLTLILLFLLVMALKISTYWRGERLKRRTPWKRGLL